MKTIHRLGRSVFTLALVGAAAYGALALTTGVSLAARPQPDCGPTRFWVCLMPGGGEQDFEGTVCERAQFERQTGAKCRPAGF